MDPFTVIGLAAVFVGLARWVCSGDLTDIDYSEPSQNLAADRQIASLKAPRGESISTTTTRPGPRGSGSDSSTQLFADDEQKAAAAAIRHAVLKERRFPRYGSEKE